MLCKFSFVAAQYVSTLDGTVATVGNILWCAVLCMCVFVVTIGVNASSVSGVVSVEVSSLVCNVSRTM